MPRKITMQETPECWVCQRTNNLENHHIFGGPNRKKSEKYNLKVWLCHNHHNENMPGFPGVHFNPKLRQKLQQEGQRRFEEIYSREAFMTEFGRNYL